MPENFSRGVLRSPTVKTQRGEDEGQLMFETFLNLN